jgi:cytoskeletal protein CcmA (bactofilin family)
MTDPVTIIGMNTMINGNLEGDEDLTIEGRVEGTVTLSRTLTIESNGVVHANINVRNAIISGVLVGNVEAADSVHVTEEGRVMGDISAPRVILVDGASFRGSIDMGEFDVERGEEMGTGATQPSSYSSEKSFEEEETVERAPVERAPTRVRTSTTRPATRSTPKPAAKKTTRKAPAKKKAPSPRVRSVGKSKATRKKR